MSSISKSPVFDPDTGFGGDGVPGTYTLPPDPTNASLLFPYAYIGCVQDGPFADYTLRLGPGKFITSHCLAEESTILCRVIQLNLPSIYGGAM